MQYISTRNKDILVSGERAIVDGICVSGGLYVPKQLPTLSLECIKSLMCMDYFERAAFILHKLLPCLDYEELLAYCNEVYSFRFGADPTPIEVHDGVAFLELWHGRTLAFKDFALQMLPYFLTKAKDLLGEKRRSLVLTATSGDTGAATMEGFCDVAGVDVAVFYPHKGVAPLQRLQMCQSEGNNTKVFGIEGNFDDAQNAIKEVFADKKFVKELDKLGYRLASANSINLGRLLPQIVYYFSSYVDLVAYGTIAFGERINYCVPSGNFGNILAGYYAKKMGLPINKLVCASNSNSVLTDFIRTGKYDIRREFLRTSSPSMDILISSNLERLIFEISGRDCDITLERMKKLKSEGFYELSKEEHLALLEDFEAEWVTDEEACRSAFDMFKSCAYLIDPHTAVGLSCYYKYVTRTNDISRFLILSTASPFKFPSSVLKAIGQGYGQDELSNLRALIRLKSHDLDEKAPKDLLRLSELRKYPEMGLSISSLLERDQRMAQRFNIEPLMSLFNKSPVLGSAIKTNAVKECILDFCRKRIN